MAEKASQGKASICSQEVSSQGYQIKEVAMHLDCPFCQLTRKDARVRLYHRDKVCIIIDCPTCGIPIVIYRSHDGPVLYATKNYMLEKARELFSDCEFGGEEASEHWHRHILTNQGGYYESRLENCD
jgi:hypothetical protein